LTDKNKNPASQLKCAIDNSKNLKYILRLYVTGCTPKSTRAIANLRNILDENLRDQYYLEVIDVYQQPAVAEEKQLIAAPTLIKELPLPVRKLIGDMSNIQRVLIGLDISKEKTR
jgi:circadian clock protein KaiB